MNVRPLQDRVLIKRRDPEDTTKGGIIIPDIAKEKPIQGEVVAIGNGRYLNNGNVVPPEIKVGDKVIFGKWSGNEVEIDGEQLLSVREDDVLGVIEKDPPQ